MLVLLMLAATVGADDKPLDVVRNVDEAGALATDVEGVRVILNKAADKTTLQAVLDRAPQLQRLHIDHPPNGVPASIRLITQFPRLEELKITGDANLDDSAFASIGRLKRLKTLNMSLP